MAANPYPELLPVILEENEIAELNNKETCTPIRGDISSQARPTEVEKLPASVAMWLEKIGKTPAKFM